MKTKKINFFMRRKLLLSIVAMPFISLFPSRRVLGNSFAGGSENPSPQKQLAMLEAQSKGRLGVAALNTADGAALLHRSSERFPFCSTFKVLLVAAILKRSAEEEALLERHVDYTPNDLLNYAPITRKYVGQGMTVTELCAAAIQYGDNTATNLLLKLLGGLSKVTAFARSIGDSEFRLDRWEPDMNTAIPGDPRDTSTPAAMAHSLYQVALGGVLATQQRKLLLGWLIGSTTGTARIRSGVPTGWQVGDKTGSGYYGTTNDLALVRPPAKPPIIVAAYFTQPDKNAKHRNDVLASVGRIVVQAFCN